MSSTSISSGISKGQIQQFAAALDNAEQSGNQIDPLTSQIPDMTIRDAYRIQDAWVNKKIAEGRKIVGHKIGLTSKVMQEAFGIDEPDFGVLLDNMVHKSGDVIDIEKFIEPRIEVELAFVLSDDITSKNPTQNDILESVDYIVPSLELIDFRTRGNHPTQKRTVKDTIADNAANAAIILGDQKIPKSESLEWVCGVLRKNGEVVHTGVASAVLGNPVNSLIWLVKKYAEFDRALQKNQIILAGSFTAPVPVQKGDVIEADFNQFGKITCSFK